MEKQLILILEGDDDLKIVEPILKAALFPMERITLHVAKGKSKAVKKAEQLLALKQENGTIAVLLDADAMTIPDAEKILQERLTLSGIEVFFVIPEIESWLFADDALLKKQLNGNAERVLNRLVLPEQIVYPKLVASHLFRQHNDLRFLEKMDISRACARSVSLNHFLRRMSEILELKTTFPPIAQADSLDRKIFANLIREVMPSEAVIFKAMDGHRFTAEQMLHHIETESVVGKEFTSDLLRVARDFLKRQANKPTPTTSIV